ncbi:serine/threonine protein kinase [Xenococcus sp. PCC 7305]|uniref:serine/threonine-protein kinase n=1 Tax=Xenococcus sp. PCC 7305 TaxID=102125 RepID=UPI0002AC45F7|nr:serine/threonine-protein kinase [Xenococcus sp. PCC 7305]ELS01901.1 serine/threonine protein kinase [Xenococcus sp. PCC 7305]
MSNFCLNPACSNPRNLEQNKFCHGCGGNLTETSQSFLFENYRVTKLLGEGGFGRTYLAEYLRRYNEPRLIKTLITNGQKQTQQKIKELFTREAAQLYQLDHPQIPKLYEYFEKDNNLYLVQEFIDGINLREELEQGKPLSSQKIETILQELLPVLTYIEGQNLLHRDIKPENIMRRHGDGLLMLIDFGAARVKTGITPTVLTTIYTPGYAAIEHMMGRPVKASDVYSLGVTCIRLLTGCLPSSTSDPIYDDNENCFCWKEYLQENKIEVSPRLIAILDRMVASSLKDRYPDSQAVLQDLLRPLSPPPVLLSTELLENEQHSTVPSPTLSIEEAKEQHPHVPPAVFVSAQTLRKSSVRFGLIAVLASFVTGLIGVVGYLLLINQPELEAINTTQESIDNNNLLVEKLEAQYNKGKYQDCYQSAAKNAHQGHNQLQEWLGKCGLAAAKLKANANSYSGAIAIAQTIPNTVPNYPEVKNSINEWSEEILNHATKVYQTGNIEEAIKVADLIPDNSSANSKIPNIIAQWKQEEQTRREVKTVGAEYHRLRDLLAAEKWQEADEETTRMMLRTAGRSQEGWFRRQDVNFSCEYLQTIDQLWSESSQGQFGFSLQKEIWQQNGSPSDARGKDSVSEGNQGSLPSDIWEGKWGMWDVTLVEFFANAAKCNL